jgi:hypothetical protein
VKEPTNTHTKTESEKEEQGGRNFYFVQHERSNFGTILLNRKMIEATAAPTAQPGLSTTEGDLKSQESSKHSDEWEFVADLSDEDNSGEQIDYKPEVPVLSSSQFPALGSPEFLALGRSTAEQAGRNKPYRVASVPEMRSFDCCSETESDHSESIHGDDSSDMTGTSEALVKVTRPKDVFVVGEKPVSIVKKLSFKDMMMLHAAGQLKEQKSKAEKADQANSPKTKQQKFAPKLVVKQIKRANYSTGDLPSLATIHDNVELSGCSGGGGLAPVRDGEVLGATDAEDFYARKSHGAKTHKNGQRCRPDEAKRKEFSQQKKVMQKDAQRACGR